MVDFQLIGMVVGSAGIGIAVAGGLMVLGTILRPVVKGKNMGLKLPAGMLVSGVILYSIGHYIYAYF